MHGPRDCFLNFCTRGARRGVNRCRWSGDYRAVPREVAAGGWSRKQDQRGGFGAASCATLFGRALLDLHFLSIIACRLSLAACTGTFTVLERHTSASSLDRELPKDGYTGKGRASVSPGQRGGTSLFDVQKASVGSSPGAVSSLT